MNALPRDMPIGRLLARTAKTVAASYGAAVEAAGGSSAAWLVLVQLGRRGPRTQNQIAADMGVRAPTLTYHLKALEAEGLVRRVAKPGDRRVKLVAPTEAGIAYYERVRRAAVAFDARLRRGFRDQELAVLRVMLARLAANASETENG